MVTLTRDAAGRSGTAGRSRSTFRRPGFSRAALIGGITPALLFFAVFVVYPLFQSVRMSLSSWGGAGPLDWVGLDNYRSVLGDSAFFHSIKITAWYALLSSAGITLIALILAAAVSHHQNRLTGLYRVLWFLPSIAPGVAVGVFWSLAFQPQTGAVNAILGMIGLGDGHTWLAQGSTAIYPAVIAQIWASTGFAFILLLGAVHSVPTELYEAVQLDGAGRIRQFVHITLPLVRPVLVTTAILEFVWNANGFAIIYALTGGGPADATSILPIQIYKEAFTYAEFGPAAATAVLGGIVLLLISLIGLRIGHSGGGSR